jgi:5,10-methylenetetrahydromethanopterin reductase
VDVSCAFATGRDTPEHIALAERLGYRRAWCYDSPALYTDVWVTLARAAERTSRIGLGIGVLIPSLRHVMTSAAAIATVERLAPGRVAVGVSTGFTGRMALGQRPLPWSRVRAYVLALQALLRGEEVEWDGAVIRMMHPPGVAPARPITVPFVIATGGPKGLEVAREVAGGVWLARGPSQPEALRQPGLPWVLHSITGTVLDPGEAAGSERVLAAAGHSAALTYHTLYERSGREGVLAAPGGEEWLRRVEAVPQATRHLAVHEGHLFALNPIDRAVVTGDLLLRVGLAGDAAHHRARLDRLKADGVTEAVYQPAGPDIPRELTAFAAAARLQPAS